MVPLKQRLYWMAPAFIKDFMASMNARKLDKQRFGPDYDRHIELISEHNGWTAERFVKYQEEQFLDLLHLAAKHVPYYRKKFSESGIDIEKIKSIEQLGLLPILEKQGVRASSESFVDERLETNKLLSGHTSGTTGTPLIVYRDVWQNSGAFAFLDARFHSVAGMRRRFNRSVSVGGHLVTAPQRSSPPFWVHNRRWNQLYMSSYQLSPRYLGYYVDELRRFKGEYIEGYPSSIYAIAQYIVDNKLEPVPFKACFTSAETLFDYHRAAIKKAFCCRTYNQYGCAEMALFAAECERGSMHLSPEIGIVEVVDEKDRPVEAGQNGHVICTSLINRVQPFIRYRIGDIGSLKPGKCLCGSPLPMFDNIEGRIDAVLITREGRRVGRLDPVFKGVNGIFEAQIVQDDYDKFRIRIVPGREYTEKDGQTAVVNLADRIGHADIRIEIVKEIERTAAGKFRAVVCNLPREQRK